MSATLEQSVGSERPSPGSISTRRISLVVMCISLMLIGWRLLAGTAVYVDTNLPATGSAIPTNVQEATVDLFLGPDRPVRLIASNLGSANRSGTIQIRATELDSTPVFRPVPLQDFTTPMSPETVLTGTSVLRVSPRSRTEERALQKPPEQRDFWLHVTSGSLEDPRGYEQVHGQLAVIREHVQVYADACLCVGGKYAESLRIVANEVADQLEQTAIPAVSQRIGPLADPDQDGRLTVLMTPWLGRLGGGSTQVRGFVRSSDFRSDVAAPFSNHGDVLYLNSDLPRGSSLTTLLLHEVTHLALSGQSDLTTAALYEWDDWLNEGMAHLVERQCGGDWSNLDYRVARYWQHTAAAPLVVDDYYCTGRWRDHACRGATFLFLNWCAARCCQQTGDDFLATLSRSHLPAVKSVERICRQDFAKLYREWTLFQAGLGAQAGREKVGRFVASGPRVADWNIGAMPDQTWQVLGTATQFVDLRAPRPGWYRLAFHSPSLPDWQLTVLPAAQSSPDIACMAIWREETSTPSPRLSVGTRQPLPANWQWDLICYEEIGQVNPRAFNWSGSQIRGSTPDDQPRWVIAQREIELPAIAARDSSAERTIKVRFRDASGNVVWRWLDVPPQPVTPATQFATVSNQIPQ